MPHPRLHGVGLGWRKQLAGDLLRQRDAVDFVEVVAETCFVDRRARSEARALAEMWPVVPHGVKLSLGSADGIDRDKVKRLAGLARELGAPLVSEHVSFTRGRDLEIGHLTPLPRTRSAVDVVARNVAVVRAELGDIPLLLENVARTIAWPDDRLDEGSFYHEVVRATGCRLLLDLGNLYANAVNEGRDPLAVLGTFPLDAVAMVHVAGGVWEHGFYFDTHAAAMPPGLFDLLDQLFARIGAVPVLLERDAEFDDRSALFGELDRLRSIAKAHPAASGDPRGSLPESPGRLDAGLADRQRSLAAALIGVDGPDAAAVGAFGEPALARTRAVLRRKRVDDALPLVPRTAHVDASLQDLALDVLASVPRPPRAVGIADALRIAHAAADHPRFGDAARLDRLVLRARFVGPDRQGVMRGRVGPFVGRERFSDGRSAWVVKGPGTSASVHVYQRTRTG